MQNHGMTLSARNQLRGQITDLELGSIMAHVVVEVGENEIESVITSPKRRRDEIEGWRHGYRGHKIHRGDAEQRVASHRRLAFSISPSGPVIRPES
jgi:hypothetical protein